MRFFTLCFSCLLVLSLRGQNFINNGGFENYEKCPNGFNTGPFLKLKRKLVNDWFIPTKGSPDYFNRCEGYKGPTFKRWSNSFTPYKGNGVVGLILGDLDEVNGFNWFYREYAESKMNGSLIKDSLYSIELFVLLLPKSEVAADSIQVCLSNKRISEWTETKFKKYVGNVHAGALGTERGWRRVVINFKATGNERYLTIGNFRGKETKFNKIDKIERKSTQQAYYLIDEVRLVTKNEIGSGFCQTKSGGDTVLLNQDIPVKELKDSVSLNAVVEILKEQSSLKMLLPNDKQGKVIFEKLKLLGIKDEQVFLSDNVTKNYFRLYF